MEKEENTEKTAYLVSVKGQDINVYPQTYGKCKDAVNHCNFDIRVFQNGQQTGQALTSDYTGNSGVALTGFAKGDYAVQTCKVDQGGNTETNNLLNRLMCNCFTCTVGTNGNCGNRRNVDVTNPSTAGAAKCTE